MTREQITEEIKIYQGLSRIYLILAEISENEKGIRKAVMERNRLDYIQKSRKAKEKAHRRFLKFKTINFEGGG